MQSIITWISVPTHYGPLCTLAYSILEHFLGKTAFGSLWGMIGSAVAGFFKKHSEDK